MGSGRSGSTILGIVLGNMEGNFFGGELHLWFKEKGISPERKEVYAHLDKIKDDMAEREAAFAFWDEVKDTITDREEFFKYDFDKKLEFHTAFPSIFFLSKKNEVVQKFHEGSEKLFSSIMNESGTNTVIDSSHYAVRAYWLSKNPALDVNYIYLFRSPVDVIMHSFKKKDIEQPPKSFLSGNGFLIAVSCLSNFVYYLLPRRKRMRLRYEDLINNPEASLTRIQKKFNLEIKNLDFKNLKPGNIFQGNRIRLRDRIALETSIKKNPANGFAKAVIYLLHAPFILLHRKRY